MPHYDFDAIRNRANCREVAESLLGLTPDQHGRCAATWRNGTNPNSVQIDDDAWFDHGAKVGGGALDLVATVRYGGVTPDALQRAAEDLGAYYRLEPATPPPRRAGLRPNPNAAPTRYDALIADGYIETARYDYTDAAGALQYQVVRLEHPERGKEFLQCRPDGRWGIKGVPRVLYNLPAIAATTHVLVVEGEKDADTLIAWGLPATTASGGAKSWDDAHTEALRGKRVAILPDNDDAGQAHAATVARALHGVAATIRIVTLSDQPKGDVTDWAAAGGTLQALRDALAAAPEWTPPVDESDLLAIAKEANKKPLRNFTLEQEQTDRGAKWVKRPRHLREIREDVYRRFCNFPRVLGTTLFNQDHNTGDIVEMHTVPKLFGWMQDKSKNTIEWWSGMGFVTKEEFFESFTTPHHGQHRYDAVSQVPDYPPRPDVYYHHPPLPDPTPDHSAFWAYIDRFLFTTCEDRHLYASCVLDALRFDPGGKPLFVFVSPDGMGSGKSQGAEQLAYLLGSQITKTTPREITERQDDLLKRILSTSGRKNRIMLLDNITGKIRSDELASLITAHSFSGRPAYARGEESRKNDLLFILTSNGAVLNSDLAVRSVFISFRKPETPGRWKEETRAWSDANRLQVFADAIDMFQRYPASTSCVPTTRFAGWETQSLWAACQGSADLHDATLFLSIERSSDSNDDVDLSETIKEAIEHALRVQCPSIYSAYSGDSKVAVFVQSSVMADWLEKPLAKVFPKANMIIPAIRDLVKSGHLPIIENHDSKGWRFRCRTGQKRGFILRKVHANPAGILSQDNKTYSSPTYSVIHRDGMVEEVDLCVTPL